MTEEKKSGSIVGCIIIFILIIGIGILVNILPNYPLATVFFVILLLGGFILFSNYIMKK